MSKTTDYKNKFAAEKYDRVGVMLPKGYKAIYQAHADKKDNGSLNSFIKRAMAETMQRDNSKQGETDNAQNTVR